MATVTTLLLVCIAWGAVTLTDATIIRGVSPSNQTLYTNGLKCMINGQEQRVPSDHINDDYCDCDDGRDEPGTSACSHLLGTVFYCDNNGFFPIHIATSVLNDGVCDCCDGSDEWSGGGRCPNTCKIDALEHRKKATERLTMIEAGYQQRTQILKTKVNTYFNSVKHDDMIMKKTLESLQQLKERVEVHKAREERKEKKMRLEMARQQYAQSMSQTSPSSQVPASSPQSTPTGNDNNAVECVSDDATSGVCNYIQSTSSLDELDAVTVEAEDKEKDEVVADISSGRPNLSPSITLSDGTSISLADYLRMEHTTIKRKGQRSAEDMRREDFLGPLFNGDPEGRRRIGLYLLRTIGLVLSPFRLALHMAWYIPDMVLTLLQSSMILQPYFKMIPRVSDITESIRFRRLAGGQLYQGYKHIQWSCQVIWDAPIVIYHYLFPTINEDWTLPEAESLREALKSIELDMEMLRKEGIQRKTDLEFDYGPDQVYYAMKEECIEKKIEKYKYQFCPFKEIKQDYILLGRWEGWGTIDDNVQDYNVMKFVNGLKCWNGPERSVRVTLECGNENTIQSVEEPSTCVYHVHVKTYLACTQDVLEQAQKDVAFWSK